VLLTRGRKREGGEGGRTFKKRRRGEEGGGGAPANEVGHRVRVTFDASAPSTAEDESLKVGDTTGKKVLKKRKKDN